MYQSTEPTDIFWLLTEKAFQQARIQQVAANKNNPRFNASAGNQILRNAFGMLEFINTELTRHGVDPEEMTVDRYCALNTFDDDISGMIRQ